MKVLVVFGTRPEAIKMAPIVTKMKGDSDINVKVCVTGQHRQMLDQVLDLFDIKADYDLNVMTPNQDLSDITAKILFGMRSVYNEFTPDVVLVHGDTTTTLAVSLSAYYKKIPIAHIEAGLRTGDIYSPWPEEANRKITTAISKYHYAPTEQAKNNLTSENICDSEILVTGNTVIDSLLSVKEKIEQNNILFEKLSNDFGYLKEYEKFVLITGHRRENFGDGFKRICTAISTLANLFPKIGFVYPVHLNPNVQKPVHEILSKKKNVYLIEPQDYLPFVFLMNSSYLILTDSGGIQEEAPSLGKPVLVLRDNTERPEALEAGTVRLVGTDIENIISNTKFLLEDANEYRKMADCINPYGDGNSSQKIIEHLKGALNAL